MVRDEEGFEIDLDVVFKSFKESKKLLIFLGILTVIGLTFYVRTRCVTNLQGKYLLGLDPYVFERYAEYAVHWEKGIPANDTMRYYPIGFDTTRELLMPTHATTVLYKVFNVFTSMSVMETAIIYPVIVTCIGMVFFYLFVKEYFGNSVAFMSSSLLGVVNGFVFRTSAGFMEKESIAIMFLFPMIYLIIKGLKTEDWKRKVLFSLLSSVCVVGSVLSWGGVNFTFLSIGGLFLASVLFNISKRRDSLVYVIVLLSVMSVTIFTGRYGNVVSILTNYMFLFIPVSLFLNLYKFEIYPKFKKFLHNYKPESLSEHAFIITSGFVVLFLISVIYPGLSYYPYFINFALERLENPFGTTAFGLSVNENQPPYFYDPNSGVDWWSPMNYTFFTMMFGSFILFYEMFRKFKKQREVITSLYVLTLLFFIFSRFSTAQEYAGITNFFNGRLFGYQYHHLVLFAFISYMIYFILKNRNKVKEFQSVKIEQLFLFIWFFITAIAARGGVRIIFAVCPPAMILSGYFFKKSYEWVSDFMGSNTIAFLSIGLIFVILAGHNIIISSLSNENFYSSFTNEWDDAMSWVQNNTSLDSVFTHWWDYGYWVQTMGNRTTTLDGGNYYVDLNHLTGRYLFAPRVFNNGTFNMSEPATMLHYNFSRPDYFLVIDDDVLKYVQMGRIGKRPTHYTIGYYNEEVSNSIGLSNSTKYPDLLIFNSYYGAFPVQQDFKYDNFLFKKGSSNTLIYNIVYPYNSETGNISYTPYALVWNQYYPGQTQIIPFNGFCEIGEGCFTLRSDGVPEYPLMMDDGGLVLIPENASDNLFTYLYLLDVPVPGFDLVYDNSRSLNVNGMASQSITDIKIYDINWTELDSFVMDKPVKNYWQEPGGAYW